MPYQQLINPFFSGHLYKLGELKAETDLSIKTNRRERQDSRYLDNKVKLAIFFLNTVLVYQTL